jgi:hypothetical protein
MRRVFIETHDPCKAASIFDTLEPKTITSGLKPSIIFMSIKSQNRPKFIDVGRRGCIPLSGAMALYYSRVASGRNP